MGFTNRNVTSSQQIIAGLSVAVISGVATAATWKVLLAGFASWRHDYWAFIPIFGIAGLALLANGIASHFGKQLPFFAKPGSDSTRDTSGSE